VHEFLLDLRYGVRTLARRPGFTLVAVLALALGIGANTAIFSVVNTVLLEPLPYSDSGRLVAVRESQVPRFPVFPVSPGAFLEWQAQSTLFEHLAAVDTAAFNLTGGDEPERLPGALVSAGVFQMLGVPPALGRGFTAAEMTLGRDLVVVVSHGLWQRRFGSDPDLIGQAITLNDRRYTVIGVGPRGLAFPNQDTQLWTPLALTAEDWASYGAHFCASSVGACRMRPSHSPPPRCAPSPPGSSRRTRTPTPAGR
jgi:putative ABC transport system permease protein